MRQPDYIILGGGKTAGGGAAQSLVSEIPTGTKDGSNVTFSLSYSPAACIGQVPAFAIWLFLNNNRMSPYSGGPQYSLSGNIITFADAPKSTDWMEALYFIGPGAIPAPGQARRFSTSSDLLDWGDASRYRILGDVGMGFWIKLPSNAGGVIMAFGSNTSAADVAYGVMVAGSSGAWNLTYFHNTLSAADTVHTFNTVIPNDTWIFVGISRDTTAKTVKLYTGTTSLTLIDTFTYTDNPSGATDPAIRLYVGNLVGGSGGGIPQSNLVATVQQHYIWSRALSQAELLNAANGAPSAASLVLSCVMGNTPEVDISTNNAVGNVTGTSLAQGH